MSWFLRFLTEFLLAPFEPNAFFVVAFASLLGVLALPFCHSLFAESKLVWLTSAKVFGLLLLGYPLWLLTGTAGLRVLPFSAFTIAIFLVVLGIVSAILWKRSGSDIAKRLNQSRRPAVISQLLFLSAFCLIVVTRMYQPDIFGQEKFMDLAFLNAHVHASSLPAADPWLFQGSINYHDGGYFLASIPVKLAGMQQGIAYNLAICLIFALSAELAFGLCYELVPRVRLAILGPMAALLFGNVQPIRQTVSFMRDSHPLKTWSFDWWAPSRIFQDQLPSGGTGPLINEFPFFSFILGDLHPHLMAIPFGILFLGLLWNLIHGAERIGWFRIASLSWVLGWLGTINVFDFLAAASLLALTMLIQSLSPREQPHPLPLTEKLRVFGGRTTLFAGTVVAGVVLFLPFWLRFDMPLRAGASVDGSKALLERLPIGFSEFRTDATQFLVVWGPQMLLLGTLAAVLLARRLKVMNRDSRRFALAISFVMACCILILFRHLVPACLALLIVVILRSSLRERSAGGIPFWHVLVLGGLCLLLLTEFLYLRDDYGRVLQRMNTVFKFHYVAWIWIGLAIPAVVSRLAVLVTGSKKRLVLLHAPVLVFLCLGMLYPLLAIHGRASEFDRSGMQRPSLDGLRYLRKQHPGDAAAIQWLLENASDGEVLLEAAGPPYGYFSRIATHTPARAVIGWANHERVWRGNSFAQVEADVDMAYASTDPAIMQQIVERYGITWIYVGEIERTLYPLEALAAFGLLYGEVYRDPLHGVSIYRTRRNDGSRES